MPIYEYRPISPSNCDYCAAGFELLRKVSDPALLVCPSCGREVKKVISAPSLSKPSASLDPSNLEKHGFTQYRKSSKGVYEKTAGKGPKVISSDPE